MAGASDSDIQQFMALTNCPLDVAQQYLIESGELSEALNVYYSKQAGSSTENASLEASEPLKGSRSSSERPSSTPSGQSQNSRKSENKLGNNGGKPKFMSFSDMVRGHADEDDEDDENRNTFAGGETSGLEVTDPNDSNSLIKDLLEKAKRGAQQHSEDADSDAQKRVHQFSGKGYRLGSVVDRANEVVEDLPEQPLPSKPKKVTREITFWKEGFQVGEGPLYRYDDPTNGFYLNELNQGRAPLKLLDVEFGQEVDVNVYKKLEESYQPPKRKLGGFQGHGQRLGSPIPGESPSSSVEPNLPVEAEAEVSTEPEIKGVEVQEIKGDSSVQIRYASGKREILRCNATDTVQFLYDHVRANTQDLTRAFTLNYAFPVKPLENFDSTLKDADLLNAVVVQRWV